MSLLKYESICHRGAACSHATRRTITARVPAERVFAERAGHRAGLLRVTARVNGLRKAHKIGIFRVTAACQVRPPSQEQLVQKYFAELFCCRRVEK